MGWDIHWRFLKDVEIVSIVERTKEPSWGQAGGLPGMANKFILRYPDGRDQEITKVTGLPVPAGSVVRLRCGGGGGYGSPREREVEAVKADIRLGYVSEAAARKHYPQTFVSA
jgi:N-methylhydantoinase B